MCSKKFRKKTNHFFLEAKMTKYVLQLYMYYNFSQYANPPKYVVDTADIWKTLYVFHICFFGQWFVEIKLKKLYILTCVFVSNFVPRYWHKMVATPCSRHCLWLCNAIFQVSMNIDHFFLIYNEKCDGRNFSYT